MPARVATIGPHDMDRKGLLRQGDMTAIEISAQVGLFAIWLLTANIVMGLLLSVRYNPLRQWPRRRINYFTLHNWTGYIALSLAILHAVVLPFSATANWSWMQVLWPAGTSQATMNIVGAISLYLLAVVVITSYFRRRLGRSTWKAVHYAGYASAALFYLHGLLLDPKLQNRPVDWIDAEKASIEVCILLVIIGTILRVRWSLAKKGRAKVRANENWEEPVPTEWSEV
jgi:DMSO/TMAO reductase YedYZ heme-binding membrane subunit